MRYALLAVALILTMPFKGRGQETDVNTRTKYFAKLKNAASDSDRMMALISIGYSIYSENKPDSAIYYYDEAFAIANRIKNNTGILRYYACYGDILSARGKFYEALAMAKKGVVIAERSKNDHYKGAAYNNIAGCYSDLRDVETAYKYYLKAVDVYERLADKEHLSAVYANILGIYFAVGHSPDKALKYGLKAIETSRAAKNYYVLEEALVNVSSVYLTMGQDGKALDQLAEAKAISTSISDKAYLVKELIMFNEIYVAQGRYSLLNNYTSEILKLGHELGDDRGLANAEYFSALYAFSVKDYAKAKDYITKAIADAKKVSDADLQQKAYGLLGDLELVGGDFVNYRHYHTLGDSIVDKLHSDQILHNTQELETKYNVAKQDERITNLNKERQIQRLTLQRHKIYMAVLFGAVVVLLGIGWLARKSNMRKEKLLISERELKEQQIQILEQEKELLLTQALMQGQEAERTRLAKDLHDGLGGILTGTKYSLSSMKQNMIISAANAVAFEKTMNMLDQSITELRRVAHNMMPESLLKLSLNEALQDYCQQVSTSGALPVTYQSFDIDKLEAAESVQITVYRVVQELINNAVKHAGAKSAIVQITLKENVLGITVEDDGKGFALTGLGFDEGMGYKNIRSRVDFLKGNMDVKSEPGKGTSVFIKLPV